MLYDHDDEEATCRAESTIEWKHMGERGRSRFPCRVSLLLVLSFIMSSRPHHVQAFSSSVSRKLGKPKSPSGRTGRKQQGSIHHQQKRKQQRDNSSSNNNNIGNNGNNKPKTIGEAVQKSQTIDELLEIAAQLWLPTDLDLPSHLRTQAIHHERRQRWSSQLLAKLGEACSFSMLGDANNDARLTRAVLAAALPYESSNNNSGGSSSSVGSHKEARSVREALLGLHSLVCRTFQGVVKGEELVLAPDMLKGIQMLHQRAEIMADMYSLKEAMEVRWAVRGLLTRLGPSVAPLFQDEHNSPSRDKSNYLASAFPRLDHRVEAIPFDILPLGIDFADSDWLNDDQGDNHVANQPDVMARLELAIPFQFDTIVTRHGTSATERRGTAWIAEPGIGALAYTGKLMEPSPIPPLVRMIMRHVEGAIQAPMDNFFDCALCNFYPDGDSACKFHTDPEHGKMWERLTCVVALGNPRIFAFRPIPSETTWSHWDVLNNSNHQSEGNDDIAPSTIRLFPGDVVLMWGRCNDMFHHAVYATSLPASSDIDLRRISLVFKRAIAHGNEGRRGHGLEGTGRRARQQKLQ
jgi:alkylated DNA repair dioxygenase AlkB